MTDPALIDDAAALTRQIETRYLARHRQQLSHLFRLAKMIEDLHEPDRDVPEGLTAILRRMVGELEVHMKEEELLVFPLVRKGSGASLAERITVVVPAADGMRRMAVEATVFVARRLSDGAKIRVESHARE